MAHIYSGQVVVIRHYLYQTDIIVYCLIPYSFLTKHKYIQTLIIYNANVDHDIKERKIEEEKKE